MPGIRFFACETCDTVYAIPDRPSNCDACGGAHLDEITDALGNAAYFSPPDR